MKLIVARLTHFPVDNLKIRVASHPAGDVFSQFFSFFRLGGRKNLHAREHKCFMTGLGWIVKSLIKVFYVD